MIGLRRLRLLSRGLSIKVCSCHQPILTQIIGYLTEADANFDIYPRAATATAYVLTLDAFLPGAATLVGNINLDD